MNDINKTIKEIRPKLRFVAPQTFWFTVGFGTFNILLGLAVFNMVALYSLNIINLIPVRMWGVLFIFHGVSIISALLTNNWRATILLHYLGATIKTAWWIALLTYTLADHSPALLFIWSLLLYMQIITIIYFTPRIKRD